MSFYGLVCKTMTSLEIRSRFLLILPELPDRTMIYQPFSNFGIGFLPNSFFWVAFYPNSFFFHQLRELTPAAFQIVQVVRSAASCSYSRPASFGWWRNLPILGEGFCGDGLIFLVIFMEIFMGQCFVVEWVEITCGYD